MPDSPKNTPKAAAQDNLGQAGTDEFPTYQDEKALKAEGKPAFQFDHGEESPAAKAEREEFEKNPNASLGLPAQMLPENQDETVK